MQLLIYMSIPEHLKANVLFLFYLYPKVFNVELICQYQSSNGGEVLSHLSEKRPRPDVPQLQGFVSEHHHQVLSKDGHRQSILQHAQQGFLKSKWVSNSNCHVA